MRYLMVAVMALTAGIATPTMAAKNEVKSVVTFEDCYRLFWVRGVHVERGELDDFNAECMMGGVPFDSGYAAGSIRQSTK
ncbi:MAG: hypothetical protein ACREB2_09470 [Pseudolabrys sp.]